MVYVADAPFEAKSGAPAYDYCAELSGKLVTRSVQSPCCCVQQSSPPAITVTGPIWMPLCGVTSAWTASCSLALISVPAAALISWLQRSC
jgi:hypothetical protein